MKWMSGKLTQLIVGLRDGLKIKNVGDKPVTITFGVQERNGFEEWALLEAGFTTMDL